MWAKILAGLGGGITIITAVGFAVDAYEDMKQFGGRIERFENSVLSLEESLGHRIEEVRGIAESADQSPESQDAIKISHMITRELDAAKKDLRRNINLDEIEGRISSVENRLRELEAEIFNKIEIESEKMKNFRGNLEENHNEYKPILSNHLEILLKDCLLSGSVIHCDFQVKNISDTPRRYSFNALANVAVNHKGNYINSMDAGFGNKNERSNMWVNIEASPNISSEYRVSFKRDEFSGDVIQLLQISIMGFAKNAFEWRNVQIKHDS